MIWRTVTRAWPLKRLPAKGRSTIVLPEAVELALEFGGLRARHAQRIDAGDDVAADAIVADHLVDAVLDRGQLRVAAEVGAVWAALASRAEETGRGKARADPGARAVAREALEVAPPVGRDRPGVAKVVGVQVLDKGQTQVVGPALDLLHITTMSCSRADGLPATVANAAVTTAAAPPHLLPAGRTRTPDSRDICMPSTVRGMLLRRRARLVAALYGSTPRTAKSCSRACCVGRSKGGGTHRRRKRGLRLIGTVENITSGHRDSCEREILGCQTKTLSPARRIATTYRYDEDARPSWAAPFWSRSLRRRIS